MSSPQGVVFHYGSFGGGAPFLAGGKVALSVSKERRLLHARVGLCTDVTPLLSHSTAGNFGKIHKNVGKFTKM
eukprot:1196239-Prorocentrum_minimum.AAC.1